MKSFTSIEQSTKLAEILPIESADMEYISNQWYDENTHTYHTKLYKAPRIKKEDGCTEKLIKLPCWSFSALLNIISTQTDTINLVQNSEGTWLIRVWNKHNISWEGGGYIEPIDACYDMVFKCNIMTTNKYKAYTSIEQSMKLSEILPIESADMYYYTTNGEMYRIPNVIENEDDLLVDENSIPCWSLAALLGVLPTPDLVRTSRGTWILTSYDANNYPWKIEDCTNPVDACVDMILELHRVKMLQ